MTHHTGRTQLSIVIILAAIFLRVVIGVHFVREGEKKLHGEYWTAGGFFSASVGPLSPLFQTLISDYDGKQRLCFDADAQGPDRVNMQPTLEKWARYKEQVARHYGFGDPEIEAVIANERMKNREVLDKLEKQAAEGELSDSDANQLKVARETERALRIEIETLRTQNARADKILETSVESLAYFFDVNNEDVNNYFNGWDKRRSGFARDGDHRSEVVAEVESLNWQQGQIYGDLLKARGPWLSEINASWTSLELELNNLALPRQFSATRPASGIEVPLAKPDQKTLLLSWIDASVPYFDMAVGILLILGLFTRYVGVIGAGFLSMIVLTQMPGFPGAQDTIAQITEMGALLMLAAIGAGRFGGLDYFIEYFIPRGTPGNEVGTHESVA
ncbi:MAG: DoxX family protein [Planctomycetota bacterium]|nr:DoxX family protein [Planctomycetota bacterium]